MRLQLYLTDHMICLFKDVLIGGKKASEKSDGDFTDAGRDSSIPDASSDRGKMPPVAVARAYQARLVEVRFALIFFVPTVCLLSCIPMVLAWTRSPRKVGNVHDAGFYQSIAGSLIQLLGLATLLWPTLFHPKISEHSWVWVWTLAVFSGVCTLVSVPLFVLLPVAWSMVVAFGGMIAQALIALQVIETF